MKAVEVEHSDFQELAFVWLTHCSAGEYLSCFFFGCVGGDHGAFEYLRSWLGPIHDLDWASVLLLDLDWEDWEADQVLFDPDYLEAPL